MRTAPTVGLACDRSTFTSMISDDDVTRLGQFATFEWREFNQPSSWDEPPPFDADAEARLVEFAGALDGLIVCHGSPRVTRAVLSAAPRLKVIGELEGDRFARRIDVDAAAELGIPVVTRPMPRRPRSRNGRSR